MSEVDQVLWGAAVGMAILNGEPLPSPSSAESTKMFVDAKPGGPPSPPQAYDGRFEVVRLQAENKRLRGLLDRAGISYE